MPTASKITRKSVKITGKAAGGKKLTIYAVSRNKNKKIGRGSINSKKKYNISIKKQKKGTKLLFVLSDKYGNLSYSKRKSKINYNYSAITNEKTIEKCLTGFFCCAIVKNAILWQDMPTMLMQQSRLML